MKIIPADDVITDLERKAQECEDRAGSEPEPTATQLKEEANLLRTWIAALKGGKWTSCSFADPVPLVADENSPVTIPKASLKVVARLPLDQICRHDGFTSSARGKCLTAEEILGLLRLGPVQFVVADVGSPLSWVQLKDCYQFWKREVKPNLAKPDSRIRLDEYPSGYCYVASEWNKADIVVLEKYH